MAQANINVQLGGSRVDLSGEIPDAIALDVIQKISQLLIGATAPAVASTPTD